MYENEYFKLREKMLIEQYNRPCFRENSFEDLIGILKKNGVNAFEAMILLCELKEVSLGEAKIRVCFSGHWGEAKRSQKELEEALKWYYEYDKREDERIERESKKWRYFWKFW